MSKTVMIIEDNPDILKSLSKLVESIQSDIVVKKFSSMSGVYDTALDSTIDLFLIDIILRTDIPGDTSGMQFAATIRNVLKYEFTPIIFITSLEDPKFYAYSQLHSFGYIEKPFDVEKTKDIIQKALRFPIQSQEEHMLYFRKDRILFPICCSDILYIESINHKMYFHKSDGNVMMIPYKTCKQIISESKDDNLLQCSRNVIINRRYVEFIDFVNKYIKIQGVDNLIDIGVTYQKRIQNYFAGTE